MISVSFQGNNQGNNDSASENDENQSAKGNESSFGSNNSIFVMKIHQRKSHLADPSGHDVVFNVTFAMAVPGVFLNTKSGESFSTRTSISDQTSRNMQQFFHLEFNLFSKEISKEYFKTDVVFYGSYAKIYPDKSESKVIPTWTDGEDTWVSWIQQYKIWTTNQHVKDLCGHKMKVLVWDTKDKCSPKVRFDRPKPPRSASKSKLTNDNVSWIKQTILMLSKEFSNTAAHKENSDRILPHQIVTSQVKRSSARNLPVEKSVKSSAVAKSSASSSSKIKDSDSVAIYIETKHETNSRLDSYGQLEKLIELPYSSNANQETRYKKAVINFKEPDLLTLKNSESNLLTESRKSVLFQTDNDSYNKIGRTGLEINMSDLFAKSQTLNRIPNSVNSLEDMFCSISVESEILSVEQKRVLNPLLIKIKKINNLPISDDDITKINRRYKPVYCEYQFGDFQPYQTIGRLHNRKIYLDDTSIILLGEMSPIKITEQLLNSFFTINVFSKVKQDHQEPDDDEQDETVECTHEQDIGDINMTSDLKTVTSSQTPNPQGEVKIDLSEMVKKNLKFLEVTVPVVPVSTIVFKEDNENFPKAVETDPRNFLEAETTMSVSFQLTESFTKNLKSSDDKDFFTRLIVINDDQRCNFIRERCTEIIIKHNCDTFNFQSQNLQDLQTFLYSMKHSSVETDNVFSGFFIVDNTYELLFVESLQSHMKHLYEELSDKLNKYQQCRHESSSLKLLYNDSLVFKNSGNYPVLTMIPLVLSKDISFFASQPLLYVRNILPKGCFEGICKLKDLITSDSLQVAVRNNLIPSNRMVENLSQFLCTHINSRMKTDVSENRGNEQKLKPQQITRKQIKTAPVYSHRNLTEKNAQPRTQTQMETKYIYPENSCEFSYSCQSKNSVSSALQQLRSQIDPKRKYTYSKDFLFSGAVDPVDLEDFYINEERKLKSEPKWINKGFKTTVEDVSEVNNLPLSRIEELKKPWKANELHASFMQPTLPERDQKDLNFDTYIRPVRLLERNPVSIMPSYMIQKQYETEKRKIDYQVWKDKICISDPRLYVHRVLPATESTQKGRKSSNQISKLQGLRKDDLKVIHFVDKKYGDPNNIPAIGVHPPEEPTNPSYTMGPENNKNLIVNYIPINQKDKSFHFIFNPRKEIPVFKNPNLKINCQSSSPFFVSC